MFKTLLNKLQKLPIFANVISLVMLLLLISGSFALGSFWTKQKTGSDNNANNQALKAPTAAPSVVTMPKPSDKDHIRGNKDAKIAIVEYSDFDCPFCSNFHTTAKQALSDYGDKVMWVYKHFPLDSLHPNARKKAEASECVYEQGGDAKFWEFADKLYSDKPTVENLGSIVTSLGLNLNQFNTCLSSGKYAQKVSNEQSEGTKYGVNGTPGNFILDISTGKATPLRGAVPITTLKQTIDPLIK